MKTEAEIRQTIDWLRHAITVQMSPPPLDEESRYVIRAMRGQIDCLLWTFGEPTFPSRN